MEIVKQQSGEFMELIVKGRLDSYWADHLSSALEEVIRGGDDCLRLNLAGVSYISSMGIRVLVRFYQQLQGINGALVVSNPSEQVKRVLDMMRLTDLLIVKPADTAKPESGRRLDRKSAAFEVFDCASDAAFTATVVGDPGLLGSCGFRKEHSRVMTFPETSMAVGLGAFGAHFEDCQNRFGEFLSLTGAAAYQPTDGSNVPDYLIAEGSFVPELEVLYAVVCEGGFSTLARFETSGDPGSIALSELVDACLEISGAEAIGVSIVAESAGLLGAALRQSPAAAAENGAPFRYPDVRSWLSFSSERSHMRSLAVISGIASRSTAGRLGPILRPMRGGSGPAGHFHAAAFSYRPMKKGRIDLKTIVRSIFEAETLQGVLHLIADDRDPDHVVESEFVRGSCWFSTIGDVR